MGMNPREFHPAYSRPGRASAGPMPLRETAGYMDSTTSGGGHRLSFANLRVNAGVTSPYLTSFGSMPARDAQLAAAVATEQGWYDPTLSTAIDVLQTQAIGTGLTLSSKPDWRRLGMTETQGRDLAHAIETGFAAYAADPDAVDFTGRFDLHVLAGAAYRVWLTRGEVLASIGWKRGDVSPYRTKLNVLPPEYLAREIFRRDDNMNIYEGVCFDNEGTVIGFMIREIPLGSLTVNNMPRFVPARTPWGRINILHILEPRDPRQVRGTTPLMAATVPAVDRAFLGERVLASAALQSVFAATIESDMRPDQVGDLLGLNEPTLSPMDALATELAPRVEWYSNNRLGAEPGKVVPLPKGDKLKMTTPGSPNQTFHDFDKNLTRQTARAAGATFEDVSGDFSETSYSASRMATYTPALLNARRRKNIAARIYHEVFRAWLEEAFSMGAIESPRGALPYWAAPDLYSRAEFLGAPPPEPDRLKAANAARTELENGLTTLTDELAKRGVDFDTHLETLKSEAAQLAELGVVHPALRPTTPAAPAEPDDDDRKPKGN